ncbi:MAG: phosphoribosyltransferase regulatory subunit [Solirubrobacterales bacterium]|jgi:ATP phosphoribosyltransferase regulatory subunit|nr:phosphoribosyltransferase regulatory subunit [Solirubrobacterales bacterium]
MHPIPSGTRDVLPDEMRELRALADTMREVFESFGYGEVYTPAIEYDTPAQRLGSSAGVYRLFDDHGAVLQLRSDMTVPIARVAATRYANVAPPLRFSSFAHVYRGVRPHRGQMREFLQAGCELIGSPSPDGTVEALTVLCRALDATGLQDYKIGLGAASLYPALMESHGVDAARQQELLAHLVGRNFVGLEHAAEGLHADLVDVPQRRGGPEVLDDLPGAEGLRRVHAGLPGDVATRVIFDLGLVRDLDYYTGAVFEVYDASIGTPIGGGGRYDELMGQLGRPMPAVGFAVGVDVLHEALAAEERDR